MCFHDRGISEHEVPVSNLTQSDACQSQSGTLEQIQRDLRDRFIRKSTWRRGSSTAADCWPGIILWQVMLSSSRRSRTSPPAVAKGGGPGGRQQQLPMETDSRTSRMWPPYYLPHLPSTSLGPQRASDLPLTKKITSIPWYRTYWRTKRPILRNEGSTCSC